MYHIVKQTSLGDIASIATSVNKAELIDAIKSILGKNYEESVDHVYVNTTTHTRYKIIDEFEYLMLLKREDPVL